MIKYIFPLPSKNHTTQSLLKDLEYNKFIDICGLSCIFRGQIFHSVLNCEVFAHLKLSN